MGFTKYLHTELWWDKGPCQPCKDKDTRISTLTFRVELGLGFVALRDTTGVGWTPLGAMSQGTPKTNQGGVQSKGLLCKGGSDGELLVLCRRLVKNVNTSNK